MSGNSCETAFEFDWMFQTSLLFFTRQNFLSFPDIFPKLVQNE